MVVFKPGQIIDGKYRIVQQIGRGGMGAVYAVENAATGARGALKVLTLDVHAHPDLFVRFQNEARAANQAGHPGVVPVYDSGQLEDGTPWLVMPFLDGEPLIARMRRAQSSTRRVIGIEGLWIVGDIASALAAAHERGVIHRDLKPGNVMLVGDPSTLTGERAMVLDFGVAKLCTDELTKKGAVLGTPVYMALEQFRDSAAVDGKADVFSLGCICYQILSGRLPHPGTTQFEIMGQRMMDPIPPLAQLVPSVPPEIATLVMAMLEKEPRARPSMSVIEGEVRRALGLASPRQTGRQASVFSQQLTMDAPSGHTESLKSFDGEALSSAATSSIDFGPSSGLAMGTPSEQRAAGEISPPPANRIPQNVPQSLSHVATAPVPMPLLQAGPQAQTVGPVPPFITPAQVASPSAHTSVDPAAQRRLYVAGGLLTLSLCLSAFLVVRPGTRRTHAQPVLAPTEPLIAKPHNVPVPVPPSPQANVQTESLDLAAPPVSTKTALESSDSGSVHKELSPRRRCEAVTGKCVSGFAISKSQQQVIAESFQEAKIKLCGNDQVAFTWKAGQLKLQNAPVGFGSDVENILKLLLKNNLQSPALPGLVTVRCNQH